MFLQWVFIIGLLVWLIGVGLLAHAVPHLLKSDDVPDYIRIGVSLSAERVMTVMAIVIVSWPLSVPVLTIMMHIKKRGQR